MNDNSTAYGLSGYQELGMICLGKDSGNCIHEKI